MAKKGDTVVVQNIVVKSVNRKSQDISNWRSAIKSFESSQNPNRVPLYDLYSDIKLDGQIVSTWGKRQDNVINKDLVFVRDGKEDEEINKLLNSPDLRNLIKDLHDSIAWGYTLAQVNNIAWDEDEERYVVDYDLIPRKHVHPEEGFECISKDQGQATRDILFKEPPLSKYMIWAGKPTDMGLFISASQYVIYKRGDFGDWTQFAELFGMPFRETRYTDYDEATRIKLEQAMEAYGSANYAILPKGAEFKLHQATSAGASNTVFKDLMSACNAEISKIILGNTLTTEQGENGARALGSVHADAEAEIHAGDLKFIRDILDTKFKAILKVYGFNVSGGNIRFKKPQKDWAALKTKWDVINGISNRVPVDDDFIYEEFDVPKPDDYEAQKEAMRNNPPEDPQQELSANKSLSRRIRDFFV